MVAPLAVPLVAVAVTGVGLAAKGAADIVQARLLARDARTRHETALVDLEAAQKTVHERVAAYGIQQLETVDTVLGRFSDWIERNEMAVNRLGHDPVDGVEVSVPELREMKDEVKQVQRWIKGGVAGAGVAIAAPKAALVGVAAFASASTGTPIASLTGAAATKATLAWLGGGSLASGGGGIAVGQAMLGLIAAAPAAFVGGITVAVVGSKQKTSAKQYVADVNVAIENVRVAITLLPMVSERVAELSGVLRALAERANRSIDTLEGLEFDPDHHAHHFAETLQLARALREVVNTPVLDERTGELTDVSFELVRKYR